MDRIFSAAPILETKNKLQRFIPQKTALYLLILLLFINVIYLDVVVFKGFGVKTIERIIQPSITKQVAGNDNNFCSQACVDRINQVASNLSTITPAPSAVITPAPVKTQVNQPTANATKEYYVPFGSGSGNSTDWQNVSGLQAYIDSTTYANIKSVIFEVSLHIPTGNQVASVRLYNATDGRVIQNSELNFNGNTSSTFMSSVPVNLDYANKLYTVQLKTQLGYTAIIDQSRVHITAQ